MSESDNIAPETKYDVFVSFRGEETRRGFLSHLIGAFKSVQINTFVDYKLERGEEIWPSLVEAIEGSSILLIIFSPYYASSQWCLDELVKILECRDKYGRCVIPVFYCVEPTHVRHQSGSYKYAFAEHEREYESKKVQFWRHAFNKSADLAGIESSKFSFASLDKNHKICTLPSPSMFEGNECFTVISVQYSFLGKENKN